MVIMKKITIFIVLLLMSGGEIKGVSEIDVVKGQAESLRDKAKQQYETLTKLQRQKLEAGQSSHPLFGQLSGDIDKLSETQLDIDADLKKLTDLQEKSTKRQLTQEEARTISTIRKAMTEQDRRLTQQGTLVEKYKEWTPVKEENEQQLSEIKKIEQKESPLKLEYVSPTSISQPESPRLDLATFSYETLMETPEEYFKNARLIEKQLTDEYNTLLVRKKNNEATVIISDPKTGAQQEVWIDDLLKERKEFRDVLKHIDDFYQIYKENARRPNDAGAIKDNEEIALILKNEIFSQIYPLIVRERTYQQSSITKGKQIAVESPRQILRGSVREGDQKALDNLLSIGTFTNKSRRLADLNGIALEMLKGVRDRGVEVVGKDFRQKRNEINEKINAVTVPSELSEQATKAARAVLYDFDMLSAYRVPGGWEAQPTASRNQRLGMELETLQKNYGQVYDAIKKLDPKTKLPPTLTELIK